MSCRLSTYLPLLPAVEHHRPLTVFISGPAESRRFI